MAALVLLAGFPAAAQGRPAQAELAGLERELLSGGSATAILGRWCADHHLAEPPRIVALRDAVDSPAPPAVRQRLGAAPGETIAYRRVRLACGERVLSAADNWYLPARLTPQMNQTLEQTDTPFGQAVRALDFHRVTLSARRLWRGSDFGAPPAEVLRIDAVLVTGSGAPFALVRETYRRDLFAAPVAATKSMK
jgi:DNA-binding GntR family transcriptional regulator